MKYNLKLNILLYLPLIFFFLPAFALCIPGIGGSGIYLWFFISIYMALFLVFIFDFQNLKNKLYNIYRKTTFKYFIFIILLVILNSLFLSLIGITTLTSTIRYSIFRIFLAILPTAIYFMYIIERQLTIKVFFKLFILLFWINLIVGFISYAGQYFDINIVNSIFDFFANKRIIWARESGLYTMNTSNYSTFGFPRLDNLHEEPSYYARYLFLFLPFSYSVGLTKLKIYKNEKLDIIIKKSIIPFTWISVLLTQSPIYLIFGLLSTAIYFVKKSKKYLYLLILLIFCAFTFIFILKLVLNSSIFANTYLSRIINVLFSINSLQQFATIEPSLGTRIISFISTFKVFLNHPFCGVGIGNVENFILDQYLNLSVYTPEIIWKIKHAIQYNQNVMYNKNVITNILASHGIFVFSLFVYAHVKLWKDFIKIKLYIKDNLEKLIAVTIQYSFINIIIWFFYDSWLLFYEYIVIYILMFLLIYKWKNIKLQERIINEKNNLYG